MRIMFIDHGIRDTEITIIDTKKQEFSRKRLTEESNINGTEKTAEKVLDIAIKYKVKRIYYKRITIDEIFGDAFRRRAKKRLGWWKRRQILNGFIGCRYSKMD